LLVSETCLQSEITHAHIDCTNGSLLLNLILFQILNQGGSSAERLIREAVAAATDQINFDPDFLVAVQLAPMRMRADLKNTGWVRHSMESALWGVMTTRSFEEALVKVVNLGNDADTAGCVAGAIAGALYGLEGIPARWKQAIHGEYPIHSGKLWFMQEFIDLADRLASII
jgi:ADP-ribosyl-[dinitrogen reductase] hydrolase